MNRRTTTKYIAYRKPTLFAWSSRNPRKNVRKYKEGRPSVATRFAKYTVKPATITKMVVTVS